MDVILHLAPPRCGAGTFHGYLHGNRALLAQHGVACWLPDRVRGLKAGRRRAGRIALALEQAARAGVRQLVICDPGPGGSVAETLRAGRPCPGIGARVAEMLALCGPVTRIVLTVRALDVFWSSCLAQAVQRGRDLPWPPELEAMAAAPGWREVIAEIAAAAPDAELMVLTHEHFAALPERRLWEITGGGLLPPLTHARERLNRAPDLDALRAAVTERGRSADSLIGTGRWMPFDAAAQAALRETYSDDLFWLTAGADGLARLARDRGNTGQAGTHPPPGATRGRHDDIEEGRMVRHR